MTTAQAYAQDTSADTEHGTVEVPAEASGISSDADREARALSEAGLTAYHAGRYESALEYFERSYALSQRGALLFNIGAAAERLRRDERAIEAYEAYLEAVPNAQNREAVLSRLEILRRHVAARQPKKDMRAIRTIPAPPPIDTAEREPRGQGVLGWTLVGVAGGALALTAAAIPWWIDRKDATDMCALPDRVCENQSTVDTQRKAALATWIAGGSIAAASLATGLFFLLRDGPKKQKQARRATSTRWGCAPGLGSAICEGTF